MFDMDNSGTINSNEELRNMIIYACYRLQTEPLLKHRAPELINASDNVDKTIAAANLPPRLDMPLAEWQKWFRLYVLKVQPLPTIPAPNQQSATEKNERSAAEMDDEVRIFALQAKRAYLKLLTNVMLNTEPGVTPTALTRQDANLWPDELQPSHWKLSWREDPKPKVHGAPQKIQSKMPTTLIEEALTAIRTLLEEPPRNQQRSGELLEALTLYVFEAVIPFLYMLWSQHFRIPTEEEGTARAVPEIQKVCCKETAEWIQKLYLEHSKDGEADHLRDLEELLEVTDCADIV